MSKIVSIYLDTDTYTRLRYKATESGISVSKLGASIIREYLDKIGAEVSIDMPPAKELAKLTELSETRIIDLIVKCNSYPQAAFPQLHISMVGDGVLEMQAPFMNWTGRIKANWGDTLTVILQRFLDAFYKDLRGGADAEQIS